MLTYGTEQQMPWSGKNPMTVAGCIIWGVILLLQVGGDDARCDLARPACDERQGGVCRAPTAALQRARSVLCTRCHGSRQGVPLISNGDERGAWCTGPKLAHYTNTHMHTHYTQIKDGGAFDEQAAINEVSGTTGMAPITIREGFKDMLPVWFQVCWRTIQCLAVPSQILVQV